MFGAVSSAVRAGSGKRVLVWEQEGLDAPFHDCGLVRHGGHPKEGLEVAGSIPVTPSRRGHSSVVLAT
jgi:hypothetical protein